MLIHTLPGDVEMIGTLQAHHHQLIRDATSYGTPPAGTVPACYPLPLTSPSSVTINRIA